MSSPKTEINFMDLIKKNELTDEEFNGITEYIQHLSDMLKTGKYVLEDEPTSLKFCDIRIEMIDRKFWFFTTVVMRTCDDNEEMEFTLNWVLSRIFVTGYLKLQKKSEV